MDFGPKRRTDPMFDAAVLWVSDHLPYPDKQYARGVTESLADTFEAMHARGVAEGRKAVCG